MSRHGEQDPLTALRAENARLIALLEQQGIDRRRPAEPSPSAPEREPTRLSTADKIALFRRLFRGRTDVYPVRWESPRTGRSGYAPACANEWRPGVCEKPRIKCADCGQRRLIPLSDAVIHEHLTGKNTVGVYPLLDDDTCCFLAVDFDDGAWDEDARAFVRSCDELGVSVALEISRSGQGAHAWRFFADKVSARDARQLGTAIISHTCARTRQLTLKSYDRLFPNQDRMPKGGFGNLIALPLQKKPRESDHSLFVDAELRPYGDQWPYLESIRLMSPDDIEPLILRATGGVHPLDVSFIDDDDLATPWKRASPLTETLSGSMPKALTVTLANLIYFEKTQLPQPLANRLIRLAAFQNPEVMQSISHRGEVKPLVENYGHIIVDECHHLGATSFEAILKHAKVKYVLGLTATPIRRDGRQPIINGCHRVCREERVRPRTQSLGVDPTHGTSRRDLGRTARQGLGPDRPARPNVEKATWRSDCRA